jgi:uncharacterized protein YciI
MFIISLNYKAELDRIDDELENHVLFLKEQYELGNFIASGRKIPRSGGVILSNMKNKNELKKIICKDPFYKNQLANYDITEFIPSMTCKELEFLIEK